MARALTQSEEEVEFLVSSSDQPSRRIELNALPSDQFIALIERKLDEYGITKIVPDDRTLADAYRRMQRQAVVQDEVDDLMMTS